MAEAIDTEGNEVYRPTGEQNAEDGGMPSITAELETMVNLAGNYTQHANFFNEVVEPMLLVLALILPEQAARLAKIMEVSGGLGKMFANLEKQFSTVSQKLAQAKAAIPAITVDPEHFQTAKRTKP